jgi:hypothetical protein
MAAQDYLAGFQTAGGGRAPVIDLSKQAAEVAKFGREQQALTREKQEAFDKERKDFREEMSDEYDSYVYENNFDGTGITDFDSSTEKLRNTIKSNQLRTEKLFDEGKISMAEVRRRNNQIKGQVNEVSELSKSINSFVAKSQEYNESGKGNRVNDLRTDILEGMTEDFNITDGPDGLVYQYKTKDESGKEVIKNINAKDFKRVLNAEQGVDIEKDLDELVTLGGFDQDIEGRFGDREQVKRYLRDSDDGKALLRTRVDNWSASEKYDYMLQTGLATDDPALAKAKGLKLIDESSVFAKEVSEEDDELITERLSDELMNRLDFKEERKEYESSLDVERIRQAGQNKRLKSKVKAKEIVVDQIDGSKKRVSEVYPTEGKGIDFEYLVQNLGTEEDYGMGAQLLDSAASDFKGVPLPVKAIKNVTFTKERVDVDSGKIEIFMGYDYDTTDPEVTVMYLETLPPTKRKEAFENIINQNNLPVEKISDFEKDPREAARFMDTMRPKQGSGVFKYVPETLSAYNQILTGTGRDPMNEEDWNKYLMNKRKSFKGGVMYKHNKK